MNWRTRPSLVYFVANAIEVGLAGGFLLASVYYFIYRQAINSTALGRTFGDPYDSLIVLGTGVSCAMILVGFGATGTSPRRLIRALGLVGLATLVLVLNIAYLHLRGPGVAAYATLGNTGFALGFLVRAWSIATATPSRVA